jgi:hypothetical protein
VHAPSSDAQRAVAIASGSNHCLALLQDGSVLSWGDNEQKQLGRCAFDCKGQLSPAVVSSMMIMSSPSVKEGSMEALLMQHGKVRVNFHIFCCC